jgi:hypothetical protein
MGGYSATPCISRILNIHVTLNEQLSKNKRELKLLVDDDDNDDDIIIKTANL